MSVSPPRPKGPHLNALRAFEAAARLGSFAAAAEELGVTAGAVSQHIKALEDWAGAALFVRAAQGVTLSMLGQRVARQFSRAFDEMDQAIRMLRSQSGQATINIAALPSVAQLWLSRRMPKIRNALREYKISITALETPPNLRREMFDISIFLGPRSKRETEIAIREDVIFPVCSPEVATQLTRHEDLATQTLLYDARWMDEWDLWLTETGTRLPAGRSGPVFSLYSIALEETKNGAGVLMGHEMLVEPYLETGELVAPFDAKIPSGKSLNLELAGEFSAASGLKKLALMLED